MTNTNIKLLCLLMGMFIFIIMLKTQDDRYEKSIKENIEVKILLTRTLETLSLSLDVNRLYIQHSSDSINLVIKNNMNILDSVNNILYKELNNKYDLNGN